MAAHTCSAVLVHSWLLSARLQFNQLSWLLHDSQAEQLPIQLDLVWSGTVNRTNYSIFMICMYMYLHRTRWCVNYQEICACYGRVTEVKEIEEFCVQEQRSVVFEME